MSAPAEVLRSSGSSSAPRPERPPNSLDGIPPALRVVPLVGAIGWLAAAIFAAARFLTG